MIPLPHAGSVVSATRVRYSGGTQVWQGGQNVGCCESNAKKTAEAIPRGKSKDTWYSGGLAFECQQSGHCCGGAP